MKRTRKSDLDHLIPCHAVQFGSEFRWK